MKNKFLNLLIKVYTFFLIISYFGNVSAEITSTLTEWNPSPVIPVVGRPIDFSWEYQESLPFFRPEDSLLVNGTFEDVETNGLPTGWDLYLTKSAQVSLSDSVFRSETRSLMFTSNSKVKLSSEQEVILLPNTTYTLAAWIKTNLSQGSIQVLPNSFARISYKDGSSKDGITQELTQGWSLHQVTFTTNKDVSGSIRIQLKNTVGTVWVDDVYLVHGDASNYSLPDNPAVPFAWNKLSNGGFEDGVNNWDIDTNSMATENTPWRGHSTMYVNSTAAGNALNQQWLTEVNGTSLEANTDYYLIAWVRTNLQSGNAEVYPSEFDDLNYYAGFNRIEVADVKDWSLYETKFRTGADTVGSINFRINQGVGEAWFDDIFLIKASQWKTSGGSSDICNIRLVEGSSGELINGPYYWDTGQKKCLADVIEYTGPALNSGQTYNWQVLKYDSLGRLHETSNAHQFVAGDIQSLAKNQAHIRTYRNFSTAQQVIEHQLDLSFMTNQDDISLAKAYDPDHIVLPYTLITTLVVPADPTISVPTYNLFDKAAALEQWAINEGLSDSGIPESMFAHFKKDAPDITLPLKSKTDPNDPEYTRTVPGWDPINDRNGDGYVDDYEFQTLVNTSASARTLYEARVPVYYWGDTTDPVNFPSDFVMNTSDPDYQRFMAEMYLPNRIMERPCCDGIYFDTASDVPPGPPGYLNVPRLEYPTLEEYKKGRIELFRQMKKNLSPETILLGNGWDSEPMVIEGSQREGWLHISDPLAKFDSRLKKAEQHSRRSLLSALKVNPIYHYHETPLSKQVSVSRERDQIYALASYYLIAGDRTYFGYSQHPYQHSDELHFDAVHFDVGEPLANYYLVVDESGTGINLLANGNFEGGDDAGIPYSWGVDSSISQFVSLDSEVRYEDNFSVRIEVPEGDSQNIIVKQFADLQPNTQYTLSAYVKVDDISLLSETSKADVYPWEYQNTIDVYHQFSYLKQPQDWTYRYYTFTTQDDVTGRVNFRLMHATGKVWFDNLALHEGLPLMIYAREYSNALVLVRPGAINDSKPLVNSSNTPLVLTNGDFETAKADGSGNPDSWIASEPVEIDSTQAYIGNSSAKIEVPVNTTVNNINKQYVTLKPFTTYTLSGYIKTEDVTGNGASIYPFEFSDSIGPATWTVLTGTHDWTFVEYTFTTGEDVEGRVNYRIHDGNGIAWFDYIVLTDNYNDPYEYQLDGYYYPVAADGSKGSAINTVTLREGEAVILAKEP